MTVRKAAIAGAWSTVDVVLRQGVGFIVSIVLARLLMPSDFGVIALLAVFGSLPIVFVQGGLTAALIQQQKSSLDEESTIFWGSVFVSIVLALAAISISPFLAAYYQNPTLQPLMFAVAAQIVLSSLGTLQTALLTRDMRFDQLSKAGLGASVLSGALGISAALMGAGVWALAIQLTAAIGLNAAFLWVVSEWRPLLRFRFAAPWSFVKFGLNVGVANALDVLYSQGFALILGKLHGVRELGLYNRAYTTQLFPSGIFSNILGRLVLPLFASRAKEPEALLRGVRLAIQLSMLVNVPVMIGLALTSDLVVLTLFGDKWLGAVKVLSILAIGGLLLPLHVINLQLLLAQGRSDRFLRVELVKKTVGIVFVVVGSFFGIVGLAYSQLIFAIVALIFNCHFTKVSLNYGILAQMKDTIGITLPTIALAGVVLTLREMLLLSASVELAVVTVSGAGAYLAAGFVMRIKCFIIAWDTLEVTIRSKKLDRNI